MARNPISSGLFSGLREGCCASLQFVYLVLGLRSDERLPGKTAGYSTSKTDLGWMQGGCFGCSVHCWVSKELTVG